MRAPKTRSGQFSLMFVAQMISYFIIVANTRAYAHGNYLWTAITEIVFGLQAFLFGKMMVEMPEMRTWYSGIGMTIGVDGGVTTGHVGNEGPMNQDLASIHGMFIIAITMIVLGPLLYLVFGTTVVFWFMSRRDGGLSSARAPLLDYKQLLIGILAWPLTILLR